MRLLNFKAQNVYGHLDFNINFFEDLNFLTGLNGTGKTTALNLIIALITPSFKQLVRTNFKIIELTFIHNGKESKIICEKAEQRLYLQINEKRSYIDLAGLPIHDESEGILHHEFRSNDIIEEIQKIPTPMFLDLNRRFIKNARDIEKKNNNAYYNHIHGKYYHENEGNKDLSLVEVSIQIKDLISSINRRKLGLAEKLKRNILKDSFTLQKLTLNGDLKTPTVLELQEYKKTILSTLNQLDLLDEGETLFDNFFLSMEEIINNLKSIEPKLNIDKKKKDRSIKEQELAILTQWLINQPQLERIIRLSAKINEHQEKVKNLEKTKERFLTSINRFYEQTNKKLVIKDDGKAEILIKGHSKDIELLSSGERQLLIILSHLNLSNDLPKSSVFIIDEPELSLHLLWQEMFVDEIMKANKDIQIILATHSPAIVNNKKHKHIPLNMDV